MEVLVSSHEIVITSPVYAFSSDQVRPDPSGYWYFKNVYMTLEGHFASLPFDGKREGLWLFDGQVFYLPDGQNNANGGK